ncbi:MAG: molecular chaperone HtpG [Candidatus Marinimicrobia bacterium]|jgi:molecular chaperone HtpG|nr:molecular chaperone HtpG [Candidatus Neomarinimicrobiota bacterium]
MSKRKFQTEVNQLLHLIIHSLYSSKEIFLRELISNASDALDKLKYLTLTDDKFKSIKYDPKIEISYLDKDNKLLTVSDCGIGMNKDGLAKNLGTIARSGTKQFLENLTGDSKKDSSLIGQFGVGFYSSFMVADKVEVISRKAGEKEAWIWTSDGKSGYSIDNSVRKTAGTDIVLHLNDEGKEFVNRWEIQNIIKKYSNHIPFPIFLHYEEEKYDKKGEVKGKEKKTDQVNAASAFWKRPKSELKKKDYNEFYKTISHDHEDPMMHIHTQAEGTLDYTTLFYIPKIAPFDLFQVDHQAGVKLYVKRVFITEDDKELMPSYLRFVRGIIDSEDLPLNVSREILQKNRILAKIKSNSVKKILSELTALTKKKDKYLEFYEQYGRLLKEGAYQDFENRDTLLELLKFKSSKTDDYTSLAEYVDRMKEDQKSIYHITGENEESLRNSPLLEMYNGKDIEVLIMDDPFDEIIIPSLQKYKEKPFKSVHHSDAADDLKTEDSKSDKKDLKPLVKKIKKVLGDQVKDVLVSSRLNESPSCIVADQNDPTAKMQEMFKTMGQSTMPDVKPILEINPEHKIVKKMKALGKTKTFEDLCWLLYEQAMLIEGVKLPNPATFVTRLNNFLIKSI